MTYSVRVTETDGKIVAWIDRANQICIEQPNHPTKLNTGENWASVQEAKAWADEHAAELIAAEAKVEADAIAKAEADALDKAAKELTIANAAKIDEIYAMLTALTNKG
jgi:membrane protein involved in colicin uptake